MTDFADGEWHRLHRATPLFRGGLAVLILAGIVFGNFRDRIVDLVFGDQGFGSGPGDDDFGGDPLDFILRENLVLAALGVALLVLLLAVGGFYLSWRMHTFRITDEVVEVRSGILFRTNRKGRLDRIQGINIARPFIPRLFGAAKLEISVAGNDANVQLSYLRSSEADALRREILLLASGARRSATAGDADRGPEHPAPTVGADGVAIGDPSSAVAPPAGVGALLEDRAREFLAPELDPSLAPPESVLRMNPGRLIGSTILTDAMIFLVLAGIGLTVAVVVTGDVLLLIGFLPALLGVGGFLVSRITRSLRYSIASTPDGVRVGFGLLSTSNETLPPGRIHSVRVNQPLLWRPFGWWQIAVNRASRSSQQGAAGQQQTTILPVGNLDDVRTVLRLLLPDVATDEAMPLLERGMLSPGGDDGYTNSPRRARALRWFSQPRNGFVLTDAGVLLRTGAIWRSLTIVPFPRMQSVSVRQGPVLRPLRLAAVHVHTVSGPITPSLGAIDRDAALALFAAVADAAIRTATVDTTHRWRASEAVPTSAAPAPAPADLDPGAPA